jgi:aquaporin Z
MFGRVPTRGVKPSGLSKALAEFVGSWTLAFVAGAVVLLGEKVWAGVAVGSVLGILSYALSGISSAHFNPAVSWSLFISRCMGGPGPAGSTWVYMLVQFIAGIWAGLCCVTLVWNSVGLVPDVAGIEWYEAGIVEMLYTCMLCFVYLNVIAARKDMDVQDDKAFSTNNYYGLALGGVIVAGAYGGGSISGGLFNPAITLGIAASDVFFQGLLGPALVNWTLTFIVFEFLGATLAALLFFAVRPEEFGRDSSAASRLTSEFVGTFLVMLTVGLNILAKSPGAAVSVGAALMSMSYAVGDISGAHFNPAVTIAAMTSGRDHNLNFKGVVIFCIVQVLGGVTAAFTYTAMHNGRSFPLGPKGDASWLQVVIAEVVFTFLLCFCVLCVAVSTRTKSPEMFGLVIGGCMTVGGFVVGGISGAVLNPALAIGIQATESALGANHEQGWEVLAYVVLEVAGALLAAGVFRATHQMEADPDSCEW